MCIGSLIGAATGYLPASTSSDALRLCLAAILVRSQTLVKTGGQAKRPLAIMFRSAQD
jgi:hypothetical protein